MIIFLIYYKVMTNIEYYGHKNLRYSSYKHIGFRGKDVYEQSVYYIPRHGKRILLETFVGTSDEIRFFKTKWLMDEPEHYNDSSWIVLNNDVPKVYRLKHCKGGD